MKPDESNAEELGDRHPRPTVIICVSDDKAGEPKEEVDCQVCVAHQAQRRVEAKCVVEEMEDDNQKCRASSQAIQYFKMLFSAACPVDADCGFGSSNSRSVHYSSISMIMR